MYKRHLLNFALLTFCFSAGTACEKKDDKNNSESETTSGDDDDDDAETGSEDESGKTENPDGGECKVGLQDCPAGQKCTGKLRTPQSDRIDDSHCVEDNGDKEFGEICTRNRDDGLDDCKKGLFCVAEGKTAGDGEGICEQFCNNSDTSLEALATSCREHGLDDTFYCFNFNDGMFPVCKATCNPLDSNCSEGEGCYAGLAPQYLCAETAVPEGSSGRDGSECSLVQHCHPGFICTSQDRLTDCETNRCCSPVCDTTDMDNSATCTADGEECLSNYENPVPGKENVGICAQPVE